MKHGFNNLFSHIKEKHPDYKDVVRSLFPDTVSNTGAVAQFTQRTMPQTSLQYMVDNKANDIFKWLGWVVMDELELSFCEQERTRNCTNLTKICSKTMKKYMFKMMDGVKQKIRAMAEACERYALIYDGWIEDNTHFIGT